VKEEDIVLAVVGLALLFGRAYPVFRKEAEKITPKPAPVQPAGKTEVVPRELPLEVEYAISQSPLAQVTPRDVKQIASPQTIIINPTPEQVQTAETLLHAYVGEPYKSKIIEASQTLSAFPDVQQQMLVNATLKALVTPPPPDPMEVHVIESGHITWCLPTGDCLFPFQSIEYDPKTGAVKITYMDGNVNYIYSKDLAEALKQYGLI
jgi:hypothetical protein